MQRICLMIAAFFCLSMTSASAEIYKCRTPDGNLFVTDQEATLPKNCQMVEVPSGDSTFNIVPETKVVDVEPSSVEPKKASSGSSQEQGQARTLVQDYRDAVRKRYHSSLMADQRRAILQIESLRKQKLQMLSDLTGSGLPRNEQEKVRKILDEIP